MTTFVVFSCIILIAAGTIFTWFIGEDDFEGCWISIGVMEGDRLIPFPGGTIQHELIFRDGHVEYRINGDHIPATRSGKKLQVELAAQICVNYRISIEEGRLVMTDPTGMKTVFEKIVEED